MNPELAAISTAMDFRVHWTGDATPFHACSVFMAAGQPPAFPAGLPPRLASALDREGTERPCEGRSRRPERTASDRVVLVDSVVVLGDSALVFLEIRKGELRYREDHAVMNLPSGGWIREVRTWGAVREHPIRRGGGSAGGGE